MTTANEAFDNQSQMAAALEQGVEVIAARESVEFRKFTKSVVSQDGFVFWVASSQTVLVEGALHLGIDRVQEEDQTIAINQVLLTTDHAIEQFNAVSPSVMWIGSWPVGPVPTPGSEEPPLTIQVAFARTGSYFRQADQWHYSGFAVYPAMSAQIIETEADLPAGPIVSNSLPIWLSLGTWNSGFGTQAVPVYPAFLVPDNIVPPYIAVKITSTIPLTVLPLLGPPGSIVPGSGPDWLQSVSSSQQCRDEVDLILYGFNNQMAIQYLQNLYDTSINAATFGFANMPVPVDEHRIQPEIAALAQKKTIHVAANYLMGTAEAIARRLLLQGIVSSMVVEPYVGTTVELSFAATALAASQLQFGATGVAT